jgi:membrane associated rhomboid family serine protease
LGGLIPLSDASRRPLRLPVVTAFIIVVNVFGFLLELMRGDAFVMQWSAIPAQIIWPDFNSYIFKKRLAE